LPEPGVFAPRRHATTGTEKLFSTTNPLNKKDERAMRNLAKSVVNFLKREDGPTAVEYAVMLALIIVVCIGAITALGKNANNTFTTVGNTVAS
jgi:pilus assembly protein Flp/PilA